MKQRINVTVDKTDHVLFAKELHRAGLTFSQYIRLIERLYLEEYANVRPDQETGTDYLRRLLEHSSARANTEGVAYRDSSASGRTYFKTDRS